MAGAAYVRPLGADWVELRSPTTKEVTAFRLSRFCVAVVPTGDGDRRVTVDLHGPRGNAFSAPCALRMGDQGEATALLAELSHALERSGRTAFAFSKDDAPFMVAALDCVVGVSAVRDPESGWKSVVQCCCRHWTFSDAESAGEQDAHAGQATSVAEKLARLEAAKPRERRACDVCQRSLAERGGGTTWTDEGAAQNSALCHACSLDAALHHRAALTETAAAMTAAPRRAKRNRSK